MKWIGERVSFVDDKQLTTIVIYPENIAWIKALMGAWFFMWLTIGVTIVWSYFNLKFTEQENIILVVFFGFWFYYFYKVGRSYFWMMWGKELIKINETSFTYKKSIRGYGKAVPYYFENIQKITTDLPEMKSIQAVWESSPWVIGGERLAFEYQGKVIRFGRKLLEKDAKLLFNLVTKRVEERMRKLK
jgi:hypothetical protein